MTPAGLSMILYLQVPECISKIPDPDDKGGQTELNDSSGGVDGFLGPGTKSAYNMARKAGCINSQGQKIS